MEAGEGVGVREEGGGEGLEGGGDAVDGGVLQRLGEGLESMLGVWAERGGRG